MSHRTVNDAVLRKAFALAAFNALWLSTASAAAEPPSIPLDPDGTLIFDGQYRPRLIVHSGRDFQGDVVSNREFVTQRARLGLTFKQESGVEVTLRVQDVRIWGEETNTLNDYSANGFDVHEAFVLIPAADWLKLKIGRQEMVFDNSRLVGNADWTQRARSFDGGRVTLDVEPLTFDFFYAKIRESEADSDGNIVANAEDDIDFGGMHTAVSVADGHTVNALYLINADHGFDDVGADHLRHTAGFNANGKFSGLTYEAEGYYQFGRMMETQVAAYMGAARLGYELDLLGKPSITGWGEYLSGDGTPEGTFDTLYATNHKFYGEMDFFLVIPRDTALLGLMDAGGRLRATVMEDIDVNGDFHHLRSVESTPTGDNVFGNEIDFGIQWKAMSKVGVRAMYGIFLPGEAIRAPKKFGPDIDLKPEHFGYLTLDAQL